MAQFTGPSGHERDQIIQATLSMAEPCWLCRDATIAYAPAPLGLDRESERILLYVFHRPDCLVLRDPQARETENEYLLDVLEVNGAGTAQYGDSVWAARHVAGRAA